MPLQYINSLNVILGSEVLSEFHKLKFEAHILNYSSNERFGAFILPEIERYKSLEKCSLDGIRTYIVRRIIDGDIGFTKEESKILYKTLIKVLYHEKVYKEEYIKETHYDLLKSILSQECNTERLFDFLKIIPMQFSEMQFSPHVQERYFGEVVKHLSEPGGFVKKYLLEGFKQTIKSILGECPKAEFMLSALDSQDAVEAQQHDIQVVAEASGLYE